MGTRFCSVQQGTMRFPQLKMPSMMALKLPELCPTGVEQPKNGASKKEMGAKSRGRSGMPQVRRQQAPHPIPKGSEGLVCPITGLYADGSEAKLDMPVELALAELQADPDIVE